MRLDRAASIGLFHPVSHLFVGHRQTRVPILMYHGISTELGGRHPYFETHTAPELFARHMQFLQENGYATVDLHEAIEAVMVGLNARKRVAITFDDGFRNFYTDAFPILAQHGFKATVFIVTGLTGETPICRQGNEYLTWREIREMHSYGIRIGSHTVSHPDLYRLSPSEIEYEIRQSKETIEDALGEFVRSFSYPYAFPQQDKRFVERLKDLLRTHGYENGVSTILGTAGPDHDWFFLPRLPVNSYDDLRFLAAKLEGGYDWLYTAQKFYKRTIKRFAKDSSDPQLATSLER
ncbi:MAG TPA: polysaccharide deacetylase family protein [Methylomirabilota bacterium]|jgi:peptidoglycan/xylan/chitin deacetylase (PgdA/CDA1 family)|nr:polysaccharide deacetylase family protein [Methylomirabilota bacterium]